MRISGPVCLPALLLCSSFAFAASPTRAPALTPDEVSATRDAAKIGEEVPAAPPVYQPDTELRFVPLPVACRAFKVAVAKTTARTLNITGTANFPAQGGKNGGCGVPGYASAVSLSLSVKAAAAAGRGTAWPTGGTKPPLISIAFVKKDLVTTGTIVPLSSAGQISISSTQAATYFGDVMGYYVKPLAGFISSSGQPYGGSSRIINATRIGAGVYEVQFDRTIRYCTAVVSAYVSSYYASASTWYDSNRPDTVRVWVWTASGAPVDQYFYISVNC
jgi:hypothetical protein